MELDNNETNKRYIQAKNRLDKLKGYYSHLAAYLFVNILISAVKIFHDVEDGATFGEAITEFDTFALWVWWGIGIAFHTFRVFGNNLLFLSRDWEERKIKEFMNEK